jgi:hypothetical protein
MVPLVQRNPGDRTAGRGIAGGAETVLSILESIF